MWTVCQAQLHSHSYWTRQLHFGWSMKQALIGWIMLLSGCSFPDSPGEKIDDGGRYFGCYALPNGETIQVSNEALTFPTRSVSFEISFRRDKFGDLVSVRPPLYLADSGNFPFKKVSGLGSILRFSNDDSNSALLIPNRNGGHTSAKKTSCPT